MMQRREFINRCIQAGIGGHVSLSVSAALGVGACARRPDLFSISLAQWSLFRELYAGDIAPLDFPSIARHEFDIHAVEYVNRFFMDKARDRAFLSELRSRCDDNGVRSLLIMCDLEGDLGDPDTAARMRAVENHYKWVEAAEFLGCHSIRVNAASTGSYADQQSFAIDGLRRLAEFAAEYDLNVIVENHGGLSSNGRWLAEVVSGVGLDNCGTLPDFGNFRISEDEEYDRYRGVSELMPMAKGVSAKSYEFDAEGNAVRTDFRRMMRIVLDAGYRGYVGIEWEGESPSAFEGIRLTKALLERLRDELADEYTA